MKIIDSNWYSEMGADNPIGIIVAEDETTGERKAYIGTGDGVDEYADALKITKHGAKLHLHTVVRINDYLKVRRK